MTDELFRTICDELKGLIPSRAPAQQLAARRYIGERLNALLGPPDLRQKRGTYVVHELAIALNTQASDISRMRWYAHYLVRHRARFDNAPTWNMCKQIIVELTAERRGKVNKPLTLK